MKEREKGVWRVSPSFRPFGVFFSFLFFRKREAPPPLPSLRR